MGIRRFLAFLRQKSSATTPILSSLTSDQFQNTTVSIDANNYFYKFLNTEEDSYGEIEQIFCAITCHAHDTNDLAIIIEHLRQCMTTSEQHLLRCLYVFCMFCYTSLRVKNLLFVLDGAAPFAKSEELVERKFKKRIAHGKLLNEKRGLLVHRIYVLRWYQILCLSLAFLHSIENVNSTTHFATPCHLALYRALQNQFEWALGTEIPEKLFNCAAESTFLAQMNASAIVCLLQVFERTKMNVQTSFLIEIDLRDAKESLIGFVLTVLLNSMNETNTCATNLANQQEANNPRPFLVCIHLNEMHKGSLSELLTNDCWEQCWKSCRANFLVCCVFHPNDNVVGGVTEFGLPSSFQNRINATLAFNNWETTSKTFWCNKDFFPHGHQHVWRSVEYVDWLCSDKSRSWLQIQGQNSTADEAVTEQQKLVHFYCQTEQVSFGQIYDTLNDESHYNLSWNEQTLALFGSFSTKSKVNLQTTTLKDQTKFSHDFFSKRLSGVKRPLEQEDTANYLTAQHFTQSEHHQLLTANVDEKHRRHLRHRMRDEFLQTVVRFLRIVCGSHVIVAEHEAEATCAKLCREKYVDYVFSDDIDALTFGSPNIVIDWPSICDIGNSLLLMGGTVPQQFTSKIIHFQNILHHFQIDSNQFILWCVLCGTDFIQIENNSSVHSLLQIIKSSKTLNECVESLINHQNKEEILSTVESGMDFFRTNQLYPPTEFLQRQLPPHSIDETVNLHLICANRKTGFAFINVSN